VRATQSTSTSRLAPVGGIHGSTRSERTTCSRIRTGRHSPTTTPGEAHTSQSDSRS